MGNGESVSPLQRGEGVSKYRRKWERVKGDSRISYLIGKNEKEGLFRGKGKQR